MKIGTVPAFKVNIFVKQKRENPCNLHVLKSELCFIFFALNKNSINEVTSLGSKNVNIIVRLVVGKVSGGVLSRRTSRGVVFSHNLTLWRFDQLIFATFHTSSQI